MVIKGIDKKLTVFIKKYRYVFLILLIGLCLMAIPSKDTVSTQEKQPATEETVREPTVSEELAQILSQVDGAGDVKVLLTVEAGEETLYQTDEDTSVTSESNTTQISTVTVTSAQKDEHGLVRQTNPPTYKGAIIVCQGADDPQIQLAIVNAVSKVTGLGADRISVLKMK